MSIADPDVQTTFKTCGPWTDEPTSCAVFDRLADETHLFKVETEVPGFYVQPKPWIETERARIDRILLPSRKLVERGWTTGAIGVECKKSGHKIGPVVAQCLDYRGACFRMPESGHMVMLDQCFIWPLDKVRGDLLSVMTQHRIGGVYEAYGKLIFWMGGTNVLEIRNNAQFDVKPILAGRKGGSR